MYTVVELASAYRDVDRLRAGADGHRSDRIDASLVGLRRREAKEQLPARPRPPGQQTRRGLGLLPRRGAPTFPPSHPGSNPRVPDRTAALTEVSASGHD